MYFRNLLDENIKDPKTAAFVRDWNKMIREENKQNNSSYGSSMPSTTLNWGTISNSSPSFSSSYHN
jgi:hypothetical protein